MPLPSNNLKQADVLEGATILPNPNGSAPGQWLDTTFAGTASSSCSSPARPRSASPSSTKSACPVSANRSPAPHRQAHPPRRHDPESQADKLLAPIYTTYTDVETTILAHAGDIQLTLLCSKPSRRPRPASTS
jgi:nicotinamide-nucleotide amidase